MVLYCSLYWPEVLKGLQSLDEEHLQQPVVSVLWTVYSGGVWCSSVVNVQYSRIFCVCKCLKKSGTGLKTYFFSFSCSMGEQVSGLYLEA